MVVPTQAHKYRIRKLPSDDK